MKPRSIKPLELSELEKFSTPRLLSFLQKLQQCEESPELSDWSQEELSQTDGIVFKTSGGRSSQYKQVQEVLKNRSNVES